MAKHLCESCKELREVAFTCPVTLCKKKYCQECVEIVTGDNETPFECPACVAVRNSSRHLRNRNDTPIKPVSLSKSSTQMAKQEEKLTPIPTEVEKAKSEEEKDKKIEELKRELELRKKNDADAVAAMEKTLQAARKEKARTDEAQKELEKARNRIEQLEAHSAEQERQKELLEQKVNEMQRDRSPSESEPDEYRNDQLNDSTESEEKETPDSLAACMQRMTTLIEKLSARNTIPCEEITLALVRDKLPELPKFSGKKEEWPLFERVYNTTNAAGKFTDDLNHLRLVKCLEGEAKTRVQSLLLGSASGDAIMKHLKKFYGDPIESLTEQSKKLLAMKSPRDLDKTQLEPFATELESLVVNAEAMGMPSFLKQPLLIESVVEKLRDSHRDWWEDKRKKESEADLRTIMEYLLERASYKSAKPSNANRSREPKRVNAHQEVQRPGCLKCNKTDCDLRRCNEFKKMNLGAKRELLRKKGVCDCCLKRGHRWKDCPEKRVCNLNGCKFHHHRLLHKNESANKSKNETPVSSASSKEGELSSAHFGNSKTLFKVLPVELIGNHGKRVRTYAFLDDGSAVTLIEDSLREELGYEGSPMPMKLRWTAKVVREEKTSKRFSCKIAMPGRRNEFPLDGVRTVEKLAIVRQSLNLKELQSTFSHLRGIPMEDQDEVEPRLLIGLKHVELLMNFRTRFGNPGEPVAAKTKLGWVIYGSNAQSMNICAVHDMSDAEDEELVLSIAKATDEDEDLHQLVDSFFKLEASGVENQENMSKEEARGLDMIKNSMKNIGSRYEVGFLWKDATCKLPDNMPMAMRRLENLERSLEKSPIKKEWTINQFKELMVKGYLRKAEKEDLEREWARTWILPTMTVVNENKIPPKPRQVYDAAAKYRGFSLNSMLMVGPDLLVNLMGAIMQTREKAICVTGDVKEMYHQIQLPIEDQQCQRILWRDCNSKIQPTIYILQRLAFGPACVPAMAIGVKNLHAEKFRDKFPIAVEGLIERTYMDDYFNRHDDVDEAADVTKQAIEIMREAGFELCKFQSNSREVLKLLPASSISESVELSPSGTENVTKILGVYWDTASDTFTYRLHEDHLNQVLANERPTKRIALRLIMKIFDPVGWLALLIIRGKIFIQEVWKDGTDWDEPVRERLHEPWKEFIQQLLCVANLKIPRRYSNVKLEEAKIELHIFTDASDKAAASCGYFRIESNDVVEVVLVSAKARVLPRQRISIPRAELKAAVIGVRLAKTIANHHSVKIASTVFWTDSKCVLQWINSDTLRMKQFVDFRVSEILESSARVQWRYVPSKLNVADDATKVKEKEITTDSRWFQGPNFLRSPADQWPRKKETEEVSKELSEEAMAECVLTINECVIKEDAFIDSISPRFKGSWISLVRVVARMIRFINVKVKKMPSAERFLRVDELETAENVIFRKIQLESFAEDYAMLMKHGRVQRTSVIYKLSPFLDDKGVIRMRSRLQNAKISYASRNPAILPKIHPLVELYVQEKHSRNYHIGEETTIADIRQKVWIINIRATLRRIMNNCALCKLRKAKPNPPMMANLAECQVEMGNKPFWVVGVDNFGPIEVSHGRGRAKRWGMIFVCLASRAVHVELVSSLSSDHCIMAIINFLAVRGPSKIFKSDNGTNFQGTSNIFSKELIQMREKLGAAVAEKFNIDWEFNPPWSPHVGGPFERMVQSIKKALSAMYNTASPRVPTDETLRAALSEATILVNSRPLTHTPIDSEDELPLCPNDLLGQSNVKSMST